jgi:DNA-binding IscR family transcriptional regulator
MKPHRNMNHSPWLWTSKAAQERAIAAAGQTGLAILCGLARLESDAPIANKDAFYASASNIAAASGIGTRTVQRLLPILEKAGILAIESGRGKGESGAHMANRIRLLDVGSPYAIEPQAYDTESCTSGGHKRKFSRREKELSSEGKESGLPAAPSGSAGGDSNPPKAVATSKEGWIR